MSKKLSKKLRVLRDEFDTVKFKCQKRGCYECCTAINYSEEEKKRMDQCLRKQGLDKPPCGKGKDYCEYLNANGKCSVYKERPIICRAFGKVNTPFLTCSYSRDCKKMEQTRAFIKYMSGFHGELLKGKGGIHDQLRKKIENGDPEGIILMVQQLLSMVKNKIITEEQFEIQIKKLEAIMKSNGDSLENYFKPKNEPIR